ncbi:hypothetical protein [Aeromicrobium sp. NPDC092404]|uniref:COG4315 family predicted lipoprotein n=1 Tax=Aeromicrobium sp. NPDC092404 TaxID=3154976 RepID=UPI0034384952
MLVRRSALLIACLLLTACSEGNGDKAESTTTPSASRTTTPGSEPAPKPSTGTEIVVADSEFGPMLFDSREQAIYLFDLEETEAPKCYGECAKAWPPVLTEGEPLAGDGVDASLLGTFRRAEGTMQVTYGGHPLYYYAHEGPGEVECHDVFLNGGNWYVVQPDGSRAP